MMIYLGGDHGGYELKEKIKEWLKSSGYEFRDLGNTQLDERDDYPDYAFKVGEEIAKHDDSQVPWPKRAKGILVCRSSAGVVIAANKVKGIRAVAVFDEKSAKHSREHNDANIMALSGDWIDEKKAKKLIQVWLKTEFSGEERHRRRLETITRYEKDR